ncbi:MAG: zinc ABC transporter substrate-binding protein [Ruminococcus sp.]|nr:zinc ABC transporter substrate-binding protein [Ruminococcus sp.]
MFRKKFIISAVSLSLAASSLTGCGSGSSSKSGVSGSGDGLKIVCTIFPEYDWVKEILGSHADSADVTYLLDSGADLHSYQPTADDILQISTCDIFVYVGGESEKWVDDALDEAVNKDMKVISLMDILGDSAKEEELKEGMQGEEEEEETEYDEHVWLSLNNAKLFCNEIESALEAADPDNSADYRSELKSYISELDSLDSSFRSLFESSSAKTLVFGDRFPFRYFTDDYGLDYYAAFVGCSAETEASFETIAFLADKIDELGCDTVFTLENSDKSIAETIISTSGRNADIAELNSLQSVSKDDIDSGASYLSLMQKNYDVLKKTLD